MMLMQLPLLQPYLSFMRVVVVGGMAAILLGKLNSPLCYLKQSCWINGAPDSLRFPYMSELGALVVGVTVWCVLGHVSPSAPAMQHQE